MSERIERQLRELGIQYTSVVWDLRVGDLIRNHRKEVGLRQIDLAARLGVSMQAVSTWERMTRAISTRQLGAIVKALGLTLTQFFGSEVTRT